MIKWSNLTGKDFSKRTSALGREPHDFIEFPKKNVNTTRTYQKNLENHGFGFVKRTRTVQEESFSYSHVSCT